DQHQPVQERYGHPRGRQAVHHPVFPARQAREGRRVREDAPAQHRLRGRGREDLPGRGEARRRFDPVAADDVPVQGRGPAALHGRRHLRPGGRARGGRRRVSRLRRRGRDRERALRGRGGRERGAARARGPRGDPDRPGPQGGHRAGREQAGHAGDGRRRAGAALREHRRPGAGGHAVQR
ncbi:MAG: Translation elongation factor P, partial [uncultured Rubrobacteraceae bacterium]